MASPEQQTLRDGRGEPVGLGTQLAWVGAMLETRGEVWVTGEGQSMWPTIRDGDRVLVRRADAIRPADIVLVRIGARLVLHRVQHVAPTGAVLTIGDANTRPELSEDRSSIVGRAVLARRGGTGRAVALEPTARFGLLAFLRGRAFLLRVLLKRAWRPAARTPMQPLPR